jgi:hypothetical protein
MEDQVKIVENLSLFESLKMKMSFFSTLITNPGDFQDIINSNKFPGKLGQRFILKSVSKFFFLFLFFLNFIRTKKKCYLV